MGILMPVVRRPAPRRAGRYAPEQAQGSNGAEDEFEVESGAAALMTTTVAILKAAPGSLPWKPCQPFVSFSGMPHVLVPGVAHLTVGAEGETKTNEEATLE
jgi:hypothetical protein